ncbi:MAG TPA: NfeD family protein [Arenimonas sp.]|uniref:NfeD family protein n=1 Tax=Arenimonas sp. TaxID=1872635 RepID=UPI002C5F90C8|nr:NfeD family protein [Arenimonas sp.]HMB56677.1 NfeD family protein [Arenimonas sp.]
MSKAMIFWACAALLLMAAEMVVPGAFLLWLGFAAAGTFVLVWLLPLAPVWQALVFVVLSLVSIGVYLQFFRRMQKASDRPLLNRRGEQMVGRVLELDTAIVDGRGRVKIGDAFWTVQGTDLPVGSKVRVVAIDSMTLKVDPAD